MHRIFSLFTEIIGWIQIVLSPLLIGSFIGAVVYFSYPSVITAVFSLALVFAGLIVGILWANREWKKEGTNHFMSRIMATPELDPKPDEKKEEINP